MNPYNEREVLLLLQDESTQRKGFEMIVSRTVVLANPADGAFSR